MIDVVGVVFNDGGRIYYFSPKDLDLEKGVNVVVETERGLQYGKVLTNIKKINEENLNNPLKRVIRKVTQDDQKLYEKNLIDSAKAYDACKELINKHKLAMNLIDASYTLDRQQLLFRFYADERVDFRKLVKDLAALYKTRIELRQIGVRDKAREVGGIGPCGRLLCCSKFLYNFDAVSINMAKNQNIALNPNKINGVCGRLLCCLTYENDEYIKAKAGLPEIGETVELKEGRGKVFSIDVLNRKYKVGIDNYGIVTVEKK